MDLRNLSDSSNNSAYRPNDNNNVSLTDIHTSTTAAFLMSTLGLPGNLLIMAVYLRSMTTSTRVYMFALAVADSITCITSAILTAKLLISASTITVLLMSARLSVLFSVFLLAYLATDRFKAIMRPHTFTLNASRAKLALVVITLVAAACTAVIWVSEVLNYELFHDTFVLCITMSSVAVMVVCYVAMATKMLQQLKTIRTRVGFQQNTQDTVTTTSSATPTVINVNEITSKQNKTAVRTSAKSQTLVYKDMMLLFTITAVFIACWMPIWLLSAGVYVPKMLKATIILNSAVNPFIYSAISKMFRTDVRNFCRKARSTLASCV